MGAWFSKNWWVVLLLGLILVGIWYFFMNKEDTPIVTTAKYPCKGHEATIKTQEDFIEKDVDWKKNVQDQINNDAHPCGKLGHTYEECLRLNAIHYLVGAGKIPASCKYW